jgi:hypothetical protein
MYLGKMKSQRATLPCVQKDQVTEQYTTPPTTDGLASSSQVSHFGGGANSATNGRKSITIAFITPISFLPS